MQRLLTVLVLGLGVACAAASNNAWAAASESTDQQLDSAPCMAAIVAGDDEKIIATCETLIGNDKAPKADRIKALVARAATHDRKGEIDRAIGDADIAVRLDPTSADLVNARGELFRKKGDRVHALSDFGNAFRLDPNNATAKSNYKALSLEVERIGAMMAI